MPPLTKVKQEKFCLEYFKCGNASESAVLAGYSIKGCRVTGSTLLTNPNIQSRLSELQLKAESKAVMSVQERIERLSEIGRADLTEFVSPDGETVRLNKDIVNHRAATEFSVRTTYTKKGDRLVTQEIKLHSPVAAIQELNKMEKVYDESPKILIQNNFYNLSLLSDEELDNLERIVTKASPLIGTNQAGENTPG